MALVQFGKNTTKTFEEAVIVGGLAGAGTYLLYQRGSVGGLPNYLVMGASAAAGKVVGDVAHDYIFPNVPKARKYESLATGLVGPGTSGLMTAGIFSVMGVPMNRAIEAGLVSGLSYVAADYGLKTISPLVPGL